MFNIENTSSIIFKQPEVVLKYLKLKQVPQHPEQGSQQSVSGLLLTRIVVTGFIFSETICS